MRKNCRYGVVGSRFLLLRLWLKMVHTPRYGPTLYIFISLYGKNDYSNYEKPTELGLAYFRTSHVHPSLIWSFKYVLSRHAHPHRWGHLSFSHELSDLGAPSHCTPTQTILLPQWFLVFHSIPFYPIVSYSRIPWNIPAFHGGSYFPLVFAQTCPTYPGTILRVW